MTRSANRLLGLGAIAVAAIVLGLLVALRTGGAAPVAADPDPPAGAEPSGAADLGATAEREHPRARSQAAEPAPIEPEPAPRLRSLAELPDLPLGAERWLAAGFGYELAVIDLRPLRDWVRAHDVTAAELCAILAERPQGVSRDALAPYALALAWTPDLDSAQVDLHPAQPGLDSAHREWLLTELLPDAVAEDAPTLAAAAVHVFRLRGDDAALGRAAVGIVQGLAPGEVADVRNPARRLLHVALKELRPEAGGVPGLDAVLDELTAPENRVMVLTETAWSAAARSGSAWAGRAIQAALGLDGFARAGLASLEDPIFLPNVLELLHQERGGTYDRFLAPSAAAALLSIGTPLALDELARFANAGDVAGRRPEIERALREHDDSAELGAVLAFRASLRGPAQDAFADELAAIVQRAKRRLDFANLGARTVERTLAGLRAALPRLPEGSPERALAERLLARHGGG